MKKAILTSLMIGSFFLHSIGQSIYTPSDVNPEKEFENIFKEEIFSDSLTSSFFIMMKKGVALHKHEFHSEHVYILSGTGDMTLDGENVSIAAGDLVVIPKNTPHSLEITSQNPMRIISIQAPKYEGKDHFLIE